MKWLMSILPVALSVVSSFVTPIDGFISHHAYLSVILGSAYAVLAHLMPSPLAPANPVGK